MRKLLILSLQVAALLGFCACGGGGGNEIAGGGGTEYPAYSTYAAQCAVPRRGIDPSTGTAYPDRVGSTTAENRWLRSWTHDLYLWYSEVTDVNPASVSTTAAYFDLMKTKAKLPSGQDKDRFHFTYDTAQWEALQNGESVGYGLLWKDDVANQIFVQFAEAGSPAAQAGVKRGDEVLSVDGVDVHTVATTSGVDTLFEGLYPAAANEMHTFVFADRNGGSNYTRTLTATNFISNPVPVTTLLNTPGGKVGYLLFNSHDLPAESELRDAINSFKNANVADLVLDLRYNGGGELFIASQLAYMIAGPTATNGKIFERTQFNDQHPNADPVTGDPLTFPFLDVTSGLGSLPSNQALPWLGFTRVYVLTGGGTCSASESIINSLRGIGISVYQIGGDTCGKPYGFYPADNCGTTYFSIQFQGVNNLGFGDYPEGFSPKRTDIAAGAQLPGCAVADDLDHELGSSSEGQLVAALNYRATGACPAAPAGLAKVQVESAEMREGAAAAWHRPPQPWRDNRFLRRPRG